MASMIQRPAAPAPQSTAAEDNGDEEQVEPDQDQEQANTPPEGPVPAPQLVPGNPQPSSQPNSMTPNMPPTVVAPDGQQQPQGNSGPQIKTPEQMLQELQRLQQQQQQQQQQKQ